MDANTLGIIVASILGSGGVGALLNGYRTSRSANVESFAALSKMWRENLADLRSELDSTNARIGRLERYNRYLISLLIEARIPFDHFED
jgi:hypothetical protein